MPASGQKKRVCSSRHVLSNVVVANVTWFIFFGGQGMGQRSVGQTSLPPTERPRESVKKTAEMVVVVYSGHRALFGTSAILSKRNSVSETWRVAASRCHSMREGRTLPCSQSEICCLVHPTRLPNSCCDQPWANRRSRINFIKLPPISVLN